MSRGKLVEQSIREGNERQAEAHLASAAKCLELADQLVQAFELESEPEARS